MGKIKSKSWERRLMGGRKWPRWLRNDRLLKWAFWLAKAIYHLWW